MWILIKFFYLGIIFFNSNFENSNSNFYDILWIGNWMSMRFRFPIQFEFLKNNAKNFDFFPKVTLNINLIIHFIFYVPKILNFFEFRRFRFELDFGSNFFIPIIEIRFLIILKQSFVFRFRKKKNIFQSANFDSIRPIFTSNNSFGYKRQFCPKLKHKVK